MKLCEHIARIYQNEIKHGNRPICVSTPKYADPHATAEMYVIMKKKLQNYRQDGIAEGYYTDYRFPKERYFSCAACGHYISGPADEHQTEWFEDITAISPNEKVIATGENIYLETGTCGKQMIPYLKIDP